MDIRIEEVYRNDGRIEQILFWHGDLDCDARVKEGEVLDVLLSGRTDIVLNPGVARRLREKLQDMLDNGELCRMI